MSVTTITFNGIPIPDIDDRTLNEFKRPGFGNLIGKKPEVLIGKFVERITTNIIKVVDDSTIGGDRIGAVTSYNKFDVDFFRYGKDIKLLKHLSQNRLSPNVTLGKEGIDDGDTIFDNSIDQYNFGQNKHYKVKSDINLKIIPFTDFKGKPKPETFLNIKQENIVGFPYVYNGRQDFAHYLNPEVASIDGAIDVFHVRSSPIGSGINDIQIRGTKGLFGTGDWTLTQNSAYGKKGSSFISEIFLAKQTQHDFYEDSQNVILTISDPGYISSGDYKNIPFVELTRFNNSYSHLNSTQKSSLLMSASRNDTVIGVDFKSKENGFMITPFYQTTEQRNFGKDSIAFSGLLKR